MPTSQQSDEQLVEIIRTKDQELYAVIVERYQAKLARYLRKFINNQDKLEDVLQEVFIKAFRNLNSFNTKQKFSPWIYRISHNEAINYIKKYSKENISLEENEIEIIDDKFDIHRDLDQKLLKSDIEQILKKMKDKYREPLILYYFEQKSYEEISDIMHIPKNSVGVLIMRAKNILKKSLANTNYGRSKNN